MAATLKLGNANWAAKEGSLLAYNDENNNFKPLPFDFTRASSATYVASDGLIKTSTTGQPRIDFLDNTNGTLLIEPQRTNLITYSEDFSQSSYGKIAAGTGIAPIVTSNYAISPNGKQNADRIQFNLNGGTSSGDTSYITTGLSAGTIDASVSIYLKTNDSTTKDITLRLGTSLFDYDVTVTSQWQRFTLSGNTNVDRIQLLLYGDKNSQTADLSVWGAQVEAGTFATSYIPTSGSTVTRVAEACSQTPASGVIGQTEGTVFFDVNISHIVGNEALGGINSGGYANFVSIERIGNTFVFFRNSATQSGNMVLSSSAITVGRYRLALAYKSGDTACFLNGTQVSTTQTQTFTNATLNVIRISGDAIGSSPFPDTYNQAQLYNTRLSNSELATLTTI